VKKWEKIGVALEFLGWKRRFIACIARSLNSKAFLYAIEGQYKKATKWAILGEFHTPLAEIVLKGTNMTDMQEVLRNYPLLTHFGFGSYQRPWDAPREGRVALLDAETEIAQARRWLRTQDRRVTLNRSHTSYGLKHIAESAMGCYIANGSLIAAALLDGWTVARSYCGSPNAMLNISERTIKHGCRCPSTRLTRRMFVPRFCPLCAGEPEDEHTAADT
jgi:hypothetical protein